MNCDLIHLACSFDPIFVVTIFSLIVGVTVVTCLLLK
jgi:hypothetical protein